MEFGLKIGFVEHLQLITTNSYNAFTNPHAKNHYCKHEVFSVCYVFTSHCLVVAFNSATGKCWLRPLTSKWLSLCLVNFCWLYFTVSWCWESCSWCLFKNWCHPFYYTKHWSLVRVFNMVFVIQSGPVNHCWPSPAQSFLVLGPVGTHDQIFRSLLTPLVLALQPQHGQHRKRNFHGSSVVM